MNKINIGSSFDEFLKEEDLYDEVETVAIKRVLMYQAQKELDFGVFGNIELIDEG